MCGIAGSIDTTRSSSSSELDHLAEAMASTLAHRGPDGGGTWVDEGAGVCLGFRRLAIIDPSSQGDQPMTSGSGRYVVVFNGEIYNFGDLKLELEQRGHRFRGHSDTEVMLAAFDQWGFEDALERLNGMFGFALWDRLEQSLRLCRDRLGEKPLYYGMVGQSFVFGSELKALRQHPLFRADIDRDALSLFLRHNYVPAPYSIYRGISKLQPGSCVTVDQHGRVSPATPYWSLSNVARDGTASSPDGGDVEWVESLDRLLSDAVRMRMIADVPLGAFLSGGIDSSTIVALMQAHSSQPVRTFSIGFEDEEFNEARHAKVVANHLGTNHTELYITPDEARDVIPSLPAIYDEPFADSSQIPTFLVSKLARGHVTVALSGDGGDELFGGYTRYLQGRSIWRAVSWLPGPVRRKGADIATSIPPDRWASLLGRLQPVLPGSLRIRNPADKLDKFASILRSQGADDVYRGLVSHWDDPTAVVLDAVEPPTALTDPTRRPSLARFSDRMMYLDTLSYLPDDILTKVDRASMAVSLEARVPFLDHRVVEFAWRVPFALKIRGGQGKWLLRQVLHRYVPPALVDRPKMGFGVPVAAWLRGPLRDWAEDLLATDRLEREGFLDPVPIRAKWVEHVSGRQDWQYHLWDVLMFQAWLREQKSVGV